MVALVTAVSTLPILLFSLAAGTFADVIDRRLVLFGAQLLMFAAAATLSVADYFSIITPALLNISGLFVTGLGRLGCSRARG